MNNKDEKKTILLDVQPVNVSLKVGNVELYEEDKTYNIVPPLFPSSGTPPEVQTTEPSWVQMRQETGVNVIAKTKTSPAHMLLNNITGHASLTSQGVEIIIEKYNEQVHRLTPASGMLLDMLIIELTGGRTDRTDETLIKLSLKEYMRKRDIKDAKTARQQVKSSMDALAPVKVKVTRGNHKGELSDYTDYYLFGGVKGIKNGEIFFRLSPEFCYVLKHAHLMDYPTAIFKTVIRKNPNTYALGRKIAEHKRMNYEKKNADIIAVKTLLEVCPDIPEYEGIKDGGNISRKIIDPFERDMNALEELNILKWEYCHSLGTALTDRELGNMNYDIFKNLLVKVTWWDYPDQTKRLQSRDKKKKKARDKKKKKARDKKKKKGGI